MTEIRWGEWTKLSGPPTNKEKMFIVVKNKETSILLLASRKIWENNLGSRESALSKEPDWRKVKEVEQKLRAQGEVLRSQTTAYINSRCHTGEGFERWGRTREMGPKKILSIRRMWLQVEEPWLDGPFEAYWPGLANLAGVGHPRAPVFLPQSHAPNCCGC